MLVPRIQIGNLTFEYASTSLVFYLTYLRKPISKLQCFSFLKFYLDSTLTSPDSYKNKLQSSKFTGAAIGRTSGILKNESLMSRQIWWNVFTLPF